ncbi:hypothetical protein OG920_02180 [Streptomyces europaeiscabiei]|uniref:hypothetical protein n=1 Tax=Streptomyces TaxID=1883 RepID=UPI000A3757C4|nr:MULTISPECIES: hypothetical protein [Streptomyces]MDX3613244.1 hypothetical protein [Streptomyces europaeiscabiei]MDX3633191.1 hypothetical protein [Streptomyces europaeiscabiei]MDX3650903.1 hypothetical protein [Streptomyces europaeiscabiei]WUD30344.1 hypothetical protein OG858_02235 [Streptomyces europaeiscabiei]
MGKLPGVLALPRMLRHLAATGEGLPPDGAVEVDGPDSALRAALAAARSGAWEPAAELLARTRATLDWDRRGEYSASLAELALHHTGWLDGWRRERPGDPDLALVAAELEIDRAWEIRTAARARHVSQEQFQAFRAVLRDAAPVLRTAADLNPGDPVPWRIHIAHAMGLGAPRDVFDEYLARGREAHPHHVGLHARAVQYLAEKWYGSHPEMFEFTESAAAAAPDGSPLRGLPLHAVTEYALDHKAGIGKGPVAWSRIEGHVEAGLELSAAFEPGDRRAAGFRNHLALALIRSGREAEALEVFRLIGTDARTFPWAYLGDAREIFLLMRQGVRVHVARRTPYFGGSVPAPAVGRPSGAAGTAEDVPPPAAMAVALVGAPLRDAREAILITGVTMRLVPAPGGSTFVEAAPSADQPGRRKGVRGTLLGEGGLPRLARTFSRGEKWPVLVAVKEGADYTLHLYRDGRLVAAHAWWADPAEMPTQKEAAERATALAAAYGVTDHRPLTAVLRGTGDPRRHVDEAFAALELPSLPSGFGHRAEPLAEVPGAQLVERRTFFRALKESLSSDSAGASGGELPPLS